MNQHTKIATVTLNRPLIEPSSFPLQGRPGEPVNGNNLMPGGKASTSPVLADYGFSIAVNGLWGQKNSHIFEQLACKRSRTALCGLPAGLRTGIKIIDEVHQETTDSTFRASAHSRRRGVPCSKL
jgi:fructose-1-phosphate kinase PfkB-like protein